MNELNNYFEWLKSGQWKNSFGFESRTMNKNFVAYLKEKQPVHFRYMRLSLATGLIKNSDDSHEKTEYWHNIIHNHDIQKAKKYLSFYIFFMSHIGNKKILRNFLQDNLNNINKIEDKDFLNFLDKNGNLKNFFALYTKEFLMECFQNIKLNSQFTKKMMHYFDSFNDIFQLVFLNKIAEWDEYETDEFIGYLKTHQKKREDGRKAVILGSQFEEYTSSLLNEFSKKIILEQGFLDPQNKEKMLKIFPNAQSSERMYNQNLYNCPKADIIVHNKDGNKLFISCKSNDKKIVVHNTKWFTLIYKNPCLNPEDQIILESINWSEQNKMGWKTLNKKQQEVCSQWMIDNYIRLHQELIFGTPSVDGILVNSGKIFKGFKPYYIEHKKFINALNEYYETNKNNPEKLLFISDDGLPCTKFLMFKVMKTSGKFRIIGRIAQMHAFTSEETGQLKQISENIDSQRIKI